MFEKFVGGSPANIAVGVTRHGMKAGFLGKVSDDQFGDYVVDYFNEQGIDTSHITRCTNGEKLGLTFTEMLSPSESSILMYRNCIADLQLSVDDIDEEYIRSAKAILISGTSLAESPSREAAIKAVMLAKRNDTRLFLISITGLITGRTRMKFPFIIPSWRKRRISSWVPGRSLT